uniref:Uncharacterized protein n=1 Tax=viral metagenome TaxID=1070528 RepID=A0A6C0L9X3_9ZZZZ
MCHHRHAVQSRLTVEQDRVIVHEVAVHNVAEVEHDLLRVHVAKTDNTTVNTANCLRTRILERAVLNQAVQLVAIEDGHTLRASQVHSNLFRNAELSDGNVRVRSNNGTGREFHTLALDVVPDTSFLAAQALLNGLEGAAISLSRRGHTRDLVVDESGNVILQNVRPLVNDRLGGVSIDLRLEIRVVRLYDLGQLVGQIVL